MGIGEISVKDVGAIRVASIRDRGPYVPTIALLFQELGSVVFDDRNRRAGVDPSGPAIFINHEKGFNQGDADIEVAFPIKRDPVFTGDRVVIRMLPAIMAVCVMYTGPYEEMVPAYEAVAKYAKEKGISLGPGSRELYYNSPDEVPSEKLATEIQVPII